MRILFVSSGNSANGITAVVSNQGDSLVSAGHTLRYFLIKGKGIKGYISNIFKLRSFLRHEKFDVVHAHYSFSGIVAALAGAKPLVVSLMGSDINLNNKFKRLVQLFSGLFWKAIIVKSNEMKEAVGIKKAVVIPNGVDTERFKPIDKEVALKITKWEPNKIHLLFAANPERKEKNFELSKGAFDRLNTNDHYELHFLKNVPSDQIPYFINASNVVLLSSLWEGSPNVIKEAMACNAPIVCTKVGDVTWLLGDVKGHYIASFESKDFEDKMRKAIDYSVNSGLTNGRQRIETLALTSRQIASKLTNIYMSLINDSELN